MNLTKYNIKFRRNSKERFWYTKRNIDLFDFKNLLKSIFEDTEEEQLTIIIDKVKTKKGDE